jgi:20S proteasome alpha/beta subunit
MTLIIGVRCKDGVVLAGDRKVMRGAECSEEKEIFEVFNNFIVGYSGLTALLDKFMSEINDYLNNNDDSTWGEFVPYLEDSVVDIFERYKDRLANIGSGVELDVLYCAKMTDDHATLCHIPNYGISEEIKSFHIIGCGYPYALPFMKSLYYPEITMDEAIKLCTCILQLIDKFNVNVYVGGIPQIVIIPDNGNPIEFSDTEIDRLLNDTKIVEKLRTAILS